MDINFWLGIFVGAVVSIITSFYANLYTENVRNYLSKRRQIKLSNKKAKELSTYYFVERLRGGEPIALLDMQRGNVVTLMSLSLSILMNTLAIIIFVDETVKYKAFFVIGPLLIGLVTFGLAVVNFLSDSNTINKAREFEAYEDDIRSKWGDDAFEISPS